MLAKLGVSTKNWLSCKQQNCYMLHTELLITISWRGTITTEKSLHVQYVIRHCSNFVRVVKVAQGTDAWMGWVIWHHILCIKEQFFY